MSMSDKEAFEFYSDPEHQVPAGPGQRRSRPGKSSHVPIRFLPETIARVKVLAAQDRKTVSAWIRDLVEREVARRLPGPRSEGMLHGEMRVESETIRSGRSFTETQQGREGRHISNLCAV
jgi:hypothetical protein